MPAASTQSGFFFFKIQNKFIIYLTKAEEFSNLFDDLLFNMRSGILIIEAKLEFDFWFLGKP